MVFWFRELAFFSRAIVRECTDIDVEFGAPPFVMINERGLLKE